jgi:hypothetical protein
MSLRLLTKPWPMVVALLFNSDAHQSEFQDLGMW